MRLLVDEMPKEPRDCPYGWVDIVCDREVVFCTKQSIAISCNDTKECEFFKSIKDYKVDVYGSPVYGVITD